MNLKGKQTHKDKFFLNFKLYPMAYNASKYIRKQTQET